MNNLSQNIVGLYIENNKTKYRIEAIFGSMYAGSYCFFGLLSNEFGYTDIKKIDDSFEIYFREVAERAKEQAPPNFHRLLGQHVIVGKKEVIICCVSVEGIVFHCLGVNENGLFVQFDLPSATVRL
jgi:hypothetical protein